MKQLETIFLPQLYQSVVFKLTYIEVCVHFLEVYLKLFLFI